MSSSVFDTRACALGEGPLWHPERQQYFWFDILGKSLLTQTADGPAQWQFDEHVSAAGWVDKDSLLIASETALLRFDISTGTQTHLCALEADVAATRSNDGRADPYGGFWIGTMGKSLEHQAGAIYRYYKGTVELLFSEITVTNAICFSPDGQYAYYADTPTKHIMRQKLNTEGWPTGAAEVFVDLNADGLLPDGAVVDSEGYLWNAQWGAGRVARYDPDGQFHSAVDVEATQASCPAFGGPDLSQLLITTAAVDAPDTDVLAGQTFIAHTGCSGQKEHRVVL